MRLALVYIAPLKVMGSSKKVNILPASMGNLSSNKLGWVGGWGQLVGYGGVPVYSLTELIPHSPLVGVKITV